MKPKKSLEEVNRIMDVCSNESFSKSQVEYRVSKLEHFTMAAMNGILANANTNISVESLAGYSIMVAKEVLTRLEKSHA